MEQNKEYSFQEELKEMEALLLELRENVILMGKAIDAIMEEYEEVSL